MIKSACENMEAEREVFNLAKGIILIFVWVALILFLYSGKKQPEKNNLRIEKEYV